VTQGTLRCTRCGKEGHVAASCKQPMPGRRGLAVIQDLRDRSDVDPATHCWLWKGAIQRDVPRMHAFDYRVNDKRTLSGPLAVWMIAHEEAPRPGWRVIRSCGEHRCVNPAHHEQMRDHAAIGEFMAATRRLKGTHIESRAANARKGRAAAGIVETDDAVIVAVAKRLQQDGYRKGDGLRLAREFNLTKSLVSNIALGKRLVPGIGRLNMRQFVAPKRPAARSRSAP